MNTLNSDRLKSDYLSPPTPSPIMPPSTAMPPQSGLISNMVRGDTGMTTPGYPSHGEGTRPPGGGLTGEGMFPVPKPIKGTGEVPSPVKGVEPRGVVSDIAGGMNAPPGLPFEAPTWQAPGKTIPGMPARGTGLIGGMVGGNMPNPTPIAPAPIAPTPITPTPVAPAPTVAPKAKKKKAAAETDPYERWKQLGRPGGSFEGWQGGG